MTRIRHAARTAAIFLGVLALAASPSRAQLEIKPAAAPAAPAKDWQTATEFDKVDFSGLTPVQKELVLKVMRSERCACGCSMKIAECRVNDPNCGMSPTLATKIVAAAKEGKAEADIIASLKESAPAGSLAEVVKIPTEGSPNKGPANAKVTIVEFSDFECPFCSRAVPWVNDVLKAYPNDVRLVFKQFPLAMHKNAKLAAIASLAAHQQGKYWEMHDKLFENNRALTRANMETWAKDLGLDVAKFTAALDNEDLAKAVDKDVADGNQAGVRGTPTFFLNGRKYSGARQTADSVKPLIDDLLKGGSGQPAATKPDAASAQPAVQGKGGIKAAPPTIQPQTKGSGK